MLVDNGTIQDKIDKEDTYNVKTSTVIYYTIK